MTTPLHRPEPLVEVRARPVDHTAPPEACARALMGGELLRVTDHYRTGVAILAALNQRLGSPEASAPFGVRQEAERSFRTAALRLLAPVRGGVVQLDDAGTCGFLTDLYPEFDAFDLPFIEVQALHGAWQRYQKGSRLAVLGRTVHPFYGAYAPSRTSHLELFGTWLSQYDGPRGQAVDVGTGCGVLAFMLAKAGVDRVVATDSNPNAVESVKRELIRLDSPLPIVPVCADLLGEESEAVDLIVFNPPWVRGEADDLLGQALCFQDGLFERFFDQAAERLAPDGRVVMVFSNVIRLMQPDVPHPIDTELNGDRFRLVQRLQRKVKPSRGPDGSKRRTREKVEVWELARAGG